VQSISNNTFALLFLSWYFPIRFPYSSLVSRRLPAYSLPVVSLFSDELRPLWRTQRESTTAIFLLDYYYYYYLYFWIFYGARSLIAAGHWRRRENDSSPWLPSSTMRVPSRCCARTHTTHTQEAPSCVVNPTVCSAKDVSRAAAVELFTTYVSRLSASYLVVCKVF
jgi:hypothetical protein